MSTSTIEPRQQPAEPQLLTASRLRCFRTCPRLHQYQYVEGFRPAMEAEALRFGSLVHAGLEAWWTAQGCAADPAATECPDPLMEALTAVAGRSADPFEAIRVEELLRGYDLRWGTAAAEYEVVGVEQEYACPQVNPATMATSRTWRLGGKIDGLLRRRADGRVLVMEHKTTIEEIEDDSAHYWSTLALDTQISGYVIGAESLGHQVDEIMYDVIRKVGIRPARATAIESRKYTKDGRLYANQREFDETPDEYRARVRAEIEEKPLRYFQRRSISRTESQLRDYLQDVWQQGRIMRDMELDGWAPRNSDACHRYGTCSFWLVCSTGTHPSDHPADYRTGRTNPELLGGV
jgi:hypothetical protein